MADEEMSDTEVWRELKKSSQHRRAENRVNSAAILAKYPEIEIEERNHNAHLIVRHAGKVVDFWPGSGKWIDRAQRGVHMRGVFRLLNHLGIKQ